MSPLAAPAKDSMTHSALSAGMVAVSAEDFDRKWGFWDGSQDWISESAVSATPNILAIVAGVTCNFRYVVRNGKRVKQEYCEDNR